MKKKGCCCYRLKLVSFFFKVSPHILPNLYLIFTDEHDMYTIRTRTRAIEIFTTIANMICTMAETNRSIAFLQRKKWLSRNFGFGRSLSRELLGPILPTFTQALVAALNVPDDSHLTDAGLKTEVLKGE